MNIRQAISACEARYLAEGGRASTWAGDYYKVLKHLPQDKKLTKRQLNAFVQRWEPNSRSRRRACVAAKYFAEFCEVEWKAGKLRGRYKPKPVDPSSIPSDEEIEVRYRLIRDPGWQWVYGAISTYGLRPHEAIRCNLEKFWEGDRKCWVPEETKTGARRVWPIHPEWYGLFNLQNAQRPPIDLERNNIRVGQSASAYFKNSADLPFNLYSLRHAWAKRAYLEGLNDKAAAKMMGHSEAIHAQTYSSWFDDLLLEKDYQEMLSKRSVRKRSNSIPEMVLDFP